jgi:hypothetical protein
MSHRMLEMVTSSHNWQFTRQLPLAATAVLLDATALMPQLWQTLDSAAAPGITRQQMAHEPCWATTVSSTSHGPSLSSRRLQEFSVTAKFFTTWASTR